MSIVPSVLLNPEDSQWIEMLQEIGDKSMRNKCYYIVLKKYDNVDNMTIWKRGNGFFIYYVLFFRGLEHYHPLPS